MPFGETDCPHCKKKVWVDVPNPPEDTGREALLGFTEAKTECPHCGIEILVRRDRDGGIQEVLVGEKEATKEEKPWWMPLVLPFGSDSLGKEGRIRLFYQGRRKGRKPR